MICIQEKALLPVSNESKIYEQIVITFGTQVFEELARRYEYVYQEGLKETEIVPSETCISSNKFSLSMTAIGLLVTFSSGNTG